MQNLEAECRKTSERSLKKPLRNSLGRAHGLIMAGIITGAAILAACAPGPKPITEERIKTACNATAFSPERDIYAPHGLLALTYPTTEIKIPNPEQLINWNIAVYDRSGRTVFSTNNPNADESYPTLSPDGKRLLFTREGPLQWVDKDRRIVRNEPTGTAGLYVADLENNSVTRLTSLSSPSASEEQPSWSPDGKKIVFLRRDTAQSNLFIISADGNGQAAQLTNLSGTDNPVFRPQFSPDGKSIAYQDWTSTYVIDADGKNQIRISEGGELESAQGRDEGFEWLPDSSGLVIERAKRLSNIAFGNRKFVVNKDGSNLTNITAVCPPRDALLD